jgi:hypothetical protein
MAAFPSANRLLERRLARLGKVLAKGAMIGEGKSLAEVLVIRRNPARGKSRSAQS